MCDLLSQYIFASHWGIAVSLMGCNALLAVEIKLFQHDALKLFIHNGDKGCCATFSSWKRLHK